MLQKRQLKTKITLIAFLITTAIMFICANINNQILSRLCLADDDDLLLVSFQYVHI